jgi:hypothetical protein
MLLSMPQEPVICVMVCGSVRAQQQCVSWPHVVVFVVRELCGRQVFFFVTFHFLCTNTIYGIQLHLFTLLIQRERVQQHFHLKGMRESIK